MAAASALNQAVLSICDGYYQLHSNDKIVNQFKCSSFVPLDAITIAQQISGRHNRRRHNCHFNRMVDPEIARKLPGNCVEIAWKLL